ncbi:hypothetical protein FPOA_13076 [Fusarium poae]|uniref:Heterokaryon incompatibility domain-containing protein n=1 Tax=Fusarium poae TaxID=36050 RepID=A0A1B8A738_FUSPO|nr:hypothetical protein FPOA_13076 [Fusarium poae]
MSRKDQKTLIREWLRICDDRLCGSNGKCGPAADHPLPTRLVDLHSVSDGDVKGDVKVVKKPVDNLTSDVDYVALSHCWGDLPMEDRNKWQFKGGVEATFRLEDLPKTFRDAIELTRLIGKQYIWIDSLCINQGDEKDWIKESETMHEVFKNAYCTIAATSSKDSHQGFLQESMTIPAGPDSSLDSDSSAYLPSFGKYFERFVENGILNTRAWVLQERALSRRIIHFTEQQPFWECGGGMTCAALRSEGYMQNGQKSFWSDPEFPMSLTKRAVTANIKLFQLLFKKYSNSCLTKMTDRPIAVKSLASALAQAIGRCQVENGIFDQPPFLQRSLLWYRDKKITNYRIDFRRTKISQPQTWSWMAYHGSIDYLKVGDDVEWNMSVKLSKTTAYSSKTTTDSSRTTTDSSKTTTDSSKTTTDSSKTTTDSSKTTTDSSKTTTDSSKTTTDSSKTTTGSSPILLTCRVVKLELEAVEPKQEGRHGPYRLLRKAVDPHQKLGSHKSGQEDTVRHHGHPNNDGVVGELRFDETTKKIPEEVRCALLGRTYYKPSWSEDEEDTDDEEDTEDEENSDKKYYIFLLVGETTPLERIGVGWVCQSVLNFNGENDVKEII